ncbi:MAG: hypothetical protein LBR33_11845 [Propionibacteriaceae bacterium]|nr:hypothetical protein [Propionibacteriaceae bacterium]
MFRGVFTTAEDPGRLAVRAAAAVKLAGPKALVCAETSLALFGCDLPDPAANETVHVWLPDDRVGPRRSGIQVHRGRLNGRPKQIQSSDWFNSAALTDCWLQLAEKTDLHDLVVIADAMMRFQDPLVFRHDFEDALATCHRLPGLRKARQALALARDGTDSPAETRLRLAMVEAGLPAPEINYPVRDVSGRMVYRLDMAYPECMVAVEYDGAVHVANATQMRRDQTRRRRLEDLGWRVITATAPDLHDPAELIASVRCALAPTAT